jgi:hypothetical protein
VCVSTGDVLRATWLDVPLVAKIATVKKSPVLGHEAIAYLGYLAHLRGVIIPEFFGLYRSEGRAYLLLEDVGSMWKDLSLKAPVLYAGRR